MGKGEFGSAGRGRQSCKAAQSRKRGGVNGTADPGPPLDYGIANKDTDFDNAMSDERKTRLEAKKEVVRDNDK